MGWTLALLLVAVGCGDDGSAPTDGATDAADAATVEVAPPAPPVLTPCPDGWAEVSEGSFTVCEPYADGAPEDCAPREVHLPGRPGCALLDGPCPSGDFADDLPSEGVLYVLAGAGAGDGTRVAPFPTIAEALSAASAGDVVAIGKGSYDELVVPPRGVFLRGACTAETTLTAPLDPRVGGVIHVTQPDVRVQGLTVADTQRHGISVSAIGTLELRDVVIDRASKDGLIVVGDGARVTADGLAIHRMQTGDADFGHAIGMAYGAVVDATRMSVREAVDTGVNAIGEGTRLSLTDSVISNTAGMLAGGGRGFGVESVMDATIELDRVVVERMREAGAFAWEGGSLTVRESIFRDNLGREESGDFGCGIALQLGGVLTVERTLVERIPDLGIFVVGGTGAHRIEDVVLRDIVPRPDGFDGHGIGVEDGAILEIRRIAVTRASSMALAFYGSEVTVEDADIVDVRENGFMEQGLGLFAGTGTTLTGDRISIRGARDVGVFAQNAGTEVSLRDLLIEGVESRSVDGRYGRGIDAERGAHLVVERGIVRDVRSVGVFAGAEETSVTLTDVAVDGVEVERCADTTCPSNHVAVGLGAYSTASLVATDFHVAGSALCGVQVGPVGEMELSSGVVSDSSIGACVLSAGFDIGRLTRDVSFRDNGTNLDVNGMLPVPDPAIIVEAEP